MFNFSANHLFLISRTEYSSCALLLMLDHDTRRVYRLLDFTKRLRPIPGKAYCVADKVNSVNRTAPLCCQLPAAAALFCWRVQTGHHCWLFHRQK